MDQIIQKFKKTAIFQNIINNYDVIFISLGGSRQIKLNTELSDYNFIIVVNNKTNYIIDQWSKYISLKCNNIWFSLKIVNIDQYCNCFNDLDYNLALSLYKRYLLQEKDIIYKNPKYNKFINYLLYNVDLKNQQKKIAYYALSIYIRNADNLNYAIKTNDYSQIIYSEYFYCFYYNLYSVNNKFDKNTYLKLYNNKYTYYNNSSNKKYTYLTINENKDICLEIKNYFKYIWDNPFDCICESKQWSKIVYEQFKLLKEEEHEYA